MHVQSVSYNLFSRRQLTVVPLTGPGAGLLLPALAASHHPHPLLHCGEFRWTRRTILPVTLCCDWPAAACAGLWLAEALLGIRCQALGDHGWPSQELWKCCQRNWEFRIPIINSDEFITFHGILTARETVRILGHTVSSFSRQDWRKVVTGLATGVCIMRRIGMPTYIYSVEITFKILLIFPLCGFEWHPKD